MMIKFIKFITNRGGVNFCLIFLLFSLSLTSSYALAVNPEEALETLLASKSLDREQTAIYIWDIEGEMPVVDYRSQFPITPASVMKCVSTAELASVMPATSRITTNVYTEGTIEKNTLYGNIIVIGSGDPSLADGRHKNQPDFVTAITDALKKKRITEVRGQIKIDDSLFEGPATHPTWSTGDTDASYGTGCHAFNYEGNASGKKAVKNPSAIFIRHLKEAMEKEGISFSEETVSSGKRQLLLAYTSPTLGNLMRSCMFRSDNLYAETFLRLFGIQNGTDGSVAASSKVAMQHWDALNYPVENIEIADGSGLSRSNRLTAEFLALVLLGRHNDPEYVSYFPLVGEEGTVRSFMKDTRLQGYMALKTGSMNGIQSYAGYVLDEDFVPTYVVVVMTNGLKNRDAYRAALSNFFLSLF